MVDTGVFATTAEVQRHVGANASTTANSEAYINQFMTEAESYINDFCRKNWTDVYPTLNADIKGILKSCAAKIAAIEVIKYDTSGLSDSEAQLRLNVLRDSYKRDLDILKEQATRKFMEETV